MKDKIKELREFLNELQHTIEQGNGATESELKQWWNDISGIITDFEHNPKSDELVEALKYMISVWDEVTGKIWRETPDHVQQKFLKAEQALKQKGV